MVKNLGQTICFSFALGVLLLGRYPLSRLVSTNRKIKAPAQINSSESYWIKSDTGNIFHVEFDGPKEAQSILFIHGLNSSLQQWFYQKLFLRDKYRLVLIDLPGHGQSLQPKEFTIDGLVTDVRTVIDYFNITNAIIYGHSIGGMVTIKYCLKYQMLNGLKGIIIQHSTYTEALKTIVFSPIFQLIKDPFIVSFLNFAIRYKNLFWLLIWINFLIGINHLFFRYIYFTGNQTPEQLRFITLISAKNSPGTVAKGILETLKFDVRNDLGKITVPTLIIGAVHDRLTKLQASVYIHQQIPASKLKIVNEGHLSLIENYREVNHTIKNFIEKL